MPQPLANSWSVYSLSQVPPNGSHRKGDCVGASPSGVTLPIMPLTVPKSTEPCVGVEVSPRFCMTREPWQKTLTNSPRWKSPTSCRCCRSSSVVAALKGGVRSHYSHPSPSGGPGTGLHSANALAGCLGSPSEEAGLKRRAGGSTRPLTFTKAIPPTKSNRAEVATDVLSPRPRAPHCPPTCHGHSPVLLTHKQVKGIFSPQEIVIIQDFHGTHPVGIKVSGNLKTDRMQQEDITGVCVESNSGTRLSFSQKPRPYSAEDAARV